MKSHMLAATALSAILASTSTQAVDIKKAEQRPIQDDLQSIRSIYDIERCIIELDTRDAPQVYKQADHPDRSMIVYNGGGVIYGLVILEGSETNTHITMRSMTGISHIEDGVKGCAGV